MSDTATTVHTTEPQEKVGFVPVVKATLERFKAHNVMVIAAGIAFFGFLALIPTMAATMAMYGLFADPNEIVDTVERAEGLDDDTRQFLVTQLKGMTETKGLGTSAVVGILLALFSASGAVQKLISTVSIAYATIERRKGFIVRGLAFLFTVGSIVGFLVLIGGLAVLPAVAESIPGGKVASAGAQIIVFPIICVGFYLSLTLLYRYGPDREQKTPWLNKGAMVGTFLFLVFTIALSMYSRFAGSMPASYAILGVFASIMLFLQLAAIAVVMGAEVNAAIEQVPVFPTFDDDSTPLRAGGNRAGTPDTSMLSPAQAVAGVAAILFLGRDD